MAVQVPPYLSGKSPEYLYDLFQTTYNDESHPQPGTKTELSCSKRPYDMNVCHGAAHNGIRYGTFERCNWIGTMCSGGQFYSKIIAVDGAQYEVRAGVFTEGAHNRGNYAVALVDAGDAQFVAQSSEKWTNNYGNEALLSAALTQACTLIEEPFSRTIYKAPPPAPIAGAALETVSSVMIVESGTHVYCDYSAAPQSIPVVLPSLATWWDGVHDFVMAVIHPVYHPTISNATASIE